MANRHGTGKKAKKVPERNGKQTERAQEPRNKIDPLVREKRLEFIRPFWEAMSKDERRALLSLPLEELRKRAELLDQDIQGLDVLKLINDALARLEDSKPTWKSWRCLFLEQQGAPEFDSAEAFRAHVRALIEAETGAPPFRDDSLRPTAAEREFRERMSALQERARAALAQVSEADAQRPRGRRLSQEQLNDALHKATVEGIQLILERLHDESPPLHDACLTPVLRFVHQHVPPEQRRSGPQELDFSDLELRAGQQEVSVLHEFLLEKVGEFAAERPPPGKKAGPEAEEAAAAAADGNPPPLDDVDLFAPLADTADALGVHPKWLQHLEQRQMGPGGKICRVTEAGAEPEEPGTEPSAPLADCPRGGLVLDWAFSRIVNTAEKARATAQSALCGGPLPREQLAAVAREAFVELRQAAAAGAALRRLRDGAKAALAEVLRLRVADAAGADAEAAPEALRLARRERALCAAKAALLEMEAHAAAEGERSAAGGIAKLHPGLRRVQAALEESDRALAARGALPLPPPLAAEQPAAEGGQAQAQAQAQAPTAAASAAAQAAAMSAVSGGEERVELLAEFRRRSAKMAALSQERDAAAAAAAAARSGARAAHARVAVLDSVLSDLSSSPPDPAAAARFDREVRPSLTAEAEAAALFDRLKAGLREVERTADRAEAALHHLETRLANTCCHDPGAAIGEHLALPLLQEGIFRAAEAAADKAAREAEAQILREVQAEEEEGRRRREAAAKARAAAAAARKPEEGVCGGGAKPSSAQAAAQEEEGGADSDGAAAEDERRRREAEEAREARRRQEEAELEAALEARRRELSAEEAALQAALLGGGAEWEATRAAVMEAEAREREEAARRAAGASGSSDGGDSAGGAGDWTESVPHHRARGRAAGNGNGNSNGSGSNGAAPGSPNGSRGARRSGGATAPQQQQQQRGKAAAPQAAAPQPQQQAKPAASEAPAKPNPSAKPAPAAPAAGITTAASVVANGASAAPRPAAVVSDLQRARAELLRVVESLKGASAAAAPFRPEEGAAALDAVAATLARAVQSLQAVSAA